MWESGNLAIFDRQSGDRQWNGNGRSPHQPSHPPAKPARRRPFTT
jgi:hypothetical protein